MILRLLALPIYFLITLPLFFEIYRSAAFNTVHRDDYAPYLLRLLGHGGIPPGAPVAYRVLSVLVATPFYYLLPFYNFSRLPTMEASYLRATEALSFVSYLSILLTAIVIYRIARNQFRASHSASAIAGLLSFFLSNFTSMVGVDPFAILVISLLVLWLPRLSLFAPLVLLSVGINEKIVCLFATVLLARWVACRLYRIPFSYYRQFVAAWLAVGGYALVRTIFRIPDAAEQTNLSLLLAHSRSTLTYIATAKGLILCALPILVLVLLIALARRSERFWVVDASGVLILVCLAVLADVKYNIGRVAMYSYPLYLPATTGFIDSVLRRGVSSNKSSDEPRVAAPGRSDQPHRELGT